MSGVCFGEFFMSRQFLKLAPAFYDPRFVPPPDRGDWTIEIEGEGFARPAVAVDFAGTVVHEKPDPFASPARQKRRQAEIDLQVEQNKEALETAIFILSQSSTGRDVLEQMTAEGYRIVFDDRRTGDRGAGGLCDPEDKLIILRSHDNPEYLALLIGHEAVHAVQNTRHDLFPSTKHKPEVGIKLSFAIEADAYAQQTQIALELFYGDPAGPDDQLHMKGPLEQMRERFPDVVRAAEKVMNSADALENGSCVAAAFQAFYDNFHLRTFYEDSHLEWADTYAPTLKKSFPWLQRHFNKDVDSGWILDRIQHKGLPYLRMHAPNLSFDDARHSGVSEESAEKIVQFYKDHLPKQSPPAALKRFGVHMKDAVNWVLGLTNHTHVIFKKGDDPTKPPLRAPPRRKWGFWE